MALLSGGKHKQNDSITKINIKVRHVCTQRLRLKLNKKKYVYATSRSSNTLTLTSAIHNIDSQSVSPTKGFSYKYCTIRIPPIVCYATLNVRISDKMQLLYAQHILR